jgi:hypothetical protein
MKKHSAGLSARGYRKELGKTASSDLKGGKQTVIDIGERRARFSVSLIDAAAYGRRSENSA